MSCEQSEVEKKFWETPELINNLLLFLDLKSILHLARAHKITQNILERTYVWNKLIKRSCPYIQRPYHDSQPKIDAVNNFVAILKLMKNPNVLLPDLLHLICERLSEEPNDRNARTTGFIQMRCSSHPELHRFSPFLLLEQLEGAFGTTEQILDSVTGGKLSGDLLTAVTSRMIRQQTPLTLFSPSGVDIDNMRSAETFNNLMHVWPEVSEQIELRVSRKFNNLRREVWEVVARAIQFKPNVVRLVTTERWELKQGRRKDLITIWNAVGLRGFRIEAGDSGGREHRTRSGEILSVVVEKHDGEMAWARLERIMGMTEGEWVTHLEWERTIGPWANSIPW